MFSNVVQYKTIKIIKDFITFLVLLLGLFSAEEYKSLLKVKDTISDSVHKPVGRDYSDTISKTPIKNNNKKKTTTI